jgi:hypothetical protein
LCGVLHFVDLAGSENQKRTGSSGQTLEEAKYINQSLLGLGQVITALTSNAAHVPYRDSKLTRILQDSLGGNARTSLIVNVSPEDCDEQETLAALRFGQRAKLVVNAPKVNTDGVDVDKLKMLLKVRDGQIEALQRKVGELEAYSQCPLPAGLLSVASYEFDAQESCSFVQPVVLQKLPKIESSISLRLAVIVVIVCISLVDLVWGTSIRSHAVQNARQGFDDWKAYHDASKLLLSQCDRLKTTMGWFPDQIAAVVAGTCMYIHPASMTAVALRNRSFEHYEVATAYVGRYALLMLLSLGGAAAMLIVLNSFAWRSFPRMFYGTIKLVQGASNTCTACRSKFMRILAGFFTSAQSWAHLVIDVAAFPFKVVRRTRVLASYLRQRALRANDGRSSSTKNKGSNALRSQGSCRAAIAGA